MLSRRFGSSKNVNSTSPPNSKASSPVGSNSILSRFSGSKSNLAPKILSFDGLYDKEISASTDNLSKAGKKYETNKGGEAKSKNSKNYGSSLNISTTVDSSSESSGHVSSLGEWFNQELEGGDNKNKSNYLSAEPKKTLLNRPKSVENLLRI